jgi:hypothetical protein
MWWARKIAGVLVGPVRRTGGKSSHKGLGKSLVGSAPFAPNGKLGLKELHLVRSESLAHKTETPR